MNMELEIFEALTAINVPAEKAKAVAESIDKAIDKRYDKRYSIHAQQLATRGDLAEAKAEIIKWCIASIFGATGMAVALAKLLS